jgi:hypothetical protein
MKTLNPNVRYIKLLLLTMIAFYFMNSLYAQPTLPQRSVTVTATQALHFGTFTLTGPAGGTITVGYNGIRTATGSVSLSAKSPLAQPAIFDIKLCQGRNITIILPPSTILTGSNGGSFTLDIGPTEKGISGSKFSVDKNCNFITTIRVGGSLTIPGSSPPGIYTGTFEITFEQE